MTKHIKNSFLFFLIASLGIFFRFYGLDWDQGTYLHPDERFLGFVSEAIRIPKDIFTYFIPQTSSMNPSNAGYAFFVYGIFPIIINKLLANALNTNTLYGLIHQGRFLSAFIDILTMLIVFKTATLLVKKYKLAQSLSYLATFFYAISVLPIQLSHFFAVDTFLNFFMFTSFYFMLCFYFDKNIYKLLLSGIFLGFALSSKITGIFLLPLLLFIFFSPKGELSFTKKSRYILGKKLILLCFYFLFCYFTVRLAEPYYFQSGNLLNVNINTHFIESIQTLRGFDNPHGWFPPAVQWIHKTPVLYSIINLSVFGIGIVFFLFVAIGTFSVLYYQPRGPLVASIIWVFLYFLYQSVQFSQPMRYFIPLYPYLALFGAFGLIYTTKGKKIYMAVSLLAVIIWPLSFFSIYTKENTRVSVSKWMYSEIPTGSILLTEHWDDPLPLLIPYSGTKKFTGEALTVFDPDTPEKWTRMNTLLNQGNYYILSSNRGWGSIPTTPERYPKMSKFYQDLFTEKLNYKKIAEFTSYPSLRYLGIPIDFPDDWADESFTVYDHPKVIIFKKE